MCVWGGGGENCESKPTDNGLLVRLKIPLLIFHLHTDIPNRNLKLLLVWTLTSALCSCLNKYRNNGLKLKVQFIALTVI